MVNSNSPAMLPPAKVTNTEDSFSANPVCMILPTTTPTAPQAIAVSMAEIAPSFKVVYMRL